MWDTNYEPPLSDKGDSVRIRIVRDKISSLQLRSCIATEKMIDLLCMPLKSDRYEVYAELVYEFV